MAASVPDREARIKAGLDALPPISRSVSDGTLRETRQFRGLTREQALRYLERLGGERIGPNELRGDGWRAEISSVVIPVGPSYRLTAVTVTWEGDPEALEPVVYGFRLKAFRAPG